MTQVVANNYSGYRPATCTTIYNYLNSSGYTNLYILNRVRSVTQTDGTTNPTLSTVQYDCGTGSISSFRSDSKL